MYLYKRETENDTNMHSSYWNGSARIGYISLKCYTDEEIAKAEKQGYKKDLRSIESVRKKRTRSNTRTDTKVDEHTDAEIQGSI